ncbi:hypothetical protein ACFPM3_06775 [Streptomyces coeruleoprunus]|uniref:Uncharacterized protein n=1 Tax=Streptomyces coeruleoprunus TaxID=285563 RepID=A0ABV9XCC0_9ACTN
MRQQRRERKACRRCGWEAVVGTDGTCRCCRAAVRLGEDEEWLAAELQRRDLAPGRPLQLAIEVDGLRLNARPLRQPRGKVPVSRPVWARYGPPPPEDNPSVCVEEVAGRLGLFAPLPRTFTREHGRRIAERAIDGLPTVLNELKHLAVERGTGPTWMVHTGGGARLALASRPPDEHLVRPEALADLPQMRPTILLALRRTGLLAPARPRIAPRWMSRTTGSCADCLAWTNYEDQRCARCLNWRHVHPIGTCHRCGRLLPVPDDHCRRCVLLLAETASGSLEGLEGEDRVVADPWARVCFTCRGLARGLPVCPGR